jgi:hypothetical protein
VSLRRCFPVARVAASVGRRLHAVVDLLKGYPFIALAAVAILLLATMVPAPIGVVAALWVILLAWLVYRRAHGTSITSAALSLTFLLALLPALTERRAAPVLSAACFCAAAWVVPHWNAVFLTHGFAADVPQQEVLEFERELSKQQRAAIYFRNY